jgi:hypothetical protein
MRCLACNKALNDFESTRKSASTGEYVDLCNGCFHNIEQDIESLEREDLRNEEDVEDTIELNDIQGDLFDGWKE